DLPHAHPVAAAQVVHRLQVATAGQCLRGGHVCVRQVDHVDVVAHAGAVRGGVVVAVDLRRAALGERVQHQREQVVGGGVRQVRGAGAHHVEVPQRGVPQPGGPVLVGQQPLTDQLRLPVRGLRGGCGRLGDQVHVRGAVGGGRGGEHDRLHLRGGHRLQHADGAGDV